MEGSLSQLLGTKCKEALKRMQRPIISSRLNIAGLLKLLEHITNLILIMEDMYIPF